MARPGFLGGNAVRNVQIPSGSAFYIMLENTDKWIDFGFINDIDQEPGAEFIEYQNNHYGSTALVKRILTNRSLILNVVAEEINPDNLRFAFFAGAPVTGSVNVFETFVSTTLAGGQVVLPEDAVEIIECRSEDGAELFAIVNFNPPSNTFQILGQGEGVRVHTTYTVQMNLSNVSQVEVIEMLASTTLSGVAQFRVRNQAGGIAQVYELDSVEVASNGAVPVAKEDIMSLPLTVTVRETNGQFGRVYTQTITSQ
jgi:hypothetical protein